MKKSTLSLFKSKLYEGGQAALSTWADGSSLVLSRLLGIPLSWEYDTEPVFEPEGSCLFSHLWLPAKKVEDLVSQRLQEIFNLTFISKKITGKYIISFEIQELQNLTLSMEIRFIHALTLFVSLENKTSLTINLYPILYDRDKGVWLEEFTVTYNVKEAAFERKINTLYYGKKPKNLFDKEKENMLELIRRSVPSMSESFSALVDSTEVKTLNYEESLTSDMKKFLYTFFIPSESLNRRGLTLNWCFSLNFLHKI